MFSDSTVLPDSKVTNPGISNQEDSPSTCKNTRVVLVPCCAGKCYLTDISSVVDISEVPVCHLLQQTSFE